MLYVEIRVRGQVRHWPIAPQADVVVGRGEGCEVVVDDDTVSRRHLRLRVIDGHVEAEDLGSVNGVEVEGRRIAKGRFPLGSTIVAGAAAVRVREGVSLGRNGTAAAVPAAGTERACESTMVPAVSSRNSTEQWPLEVLEKRLHGVASAQDAATALLGFLIDRARLDGAAIVRAQGEGLGVVASMGTLPEDAIAVAAIRESGSGAAETSAVAQARRLVDAPVPLWLVMHPQPIGAQAQVVVSLVASLVTALFEGDRDAPRARVRALAAAPGLVPAPAASIAEPVIVAASEAFLATLEELDSLAASDLPVLIAGESGVGKELLARRLHVRSARRAAPFVAINCAALPRDLLEAELFGIERGVATGVEPRPGRFVLADGGTLLLDEVGDLPLDLQPKLLRVLESREMLRLGAARPIAIDVRIVSATNQKLIERVETGAFRRDLYHRIAGATVRVPALRDRPEDILPLARHFARREGVARGIDLAGLDFEAARLLLGHAWPGNVRQLHHVIARAAALARGSLVTADLLPEGFAAHVDDARAGLVLALRGDLRTARRAFERHYFARLLARAGGNMSEAARAAGITRSHLYQKLDELGMRHAPDES